MKQRQSDGFTMLELVLVLMVISVLFIAGFRSWTDSADREGFQETMKEMETFRLATVGDETRVELGRRIDFGYWGTAAAWPTALTDLSPWLIVANASDISQDAWGTAYVISSSATEWTITSYGADGAAGGTGFNTDIALTLKRADYENNRVAIFVHDARGTLLLPSADDGNNLTNGHIARVVFREHAGSGTYTDNAWSSSEGGLNQSNGNFWSGLTIAAGPCQVIVEVADGTGSASGTYRGTYDWRGELIGDSSQSTITKDFIVYPIGDSGKANVFYIKTPGVACWGVNEV